MLHCAERAAVLACDTHRVPAFFGKAGLLKHEDPIGLPHIRSDEPMVRLEHQGLVPWHVAPPSLHRSDTTGVALQGDRFDRCAFEPTQLAHHIPKNMLARLTPPKTLPEGGMKGTEFVEASRDLTRAYVKTRQCVAIICGTTRR